MSSQKKTKFLTVKDFKKFLDQFPEDLAVVLHNNPMGWVNGVEGWEDEMYYRDRSKTNKMLMLFEDDKDKRKKRKVLKLEGYHK